MARGGNVGGWGRNIKRRTDDVTSSISASGSAPARVMQSSTRRGRPVSRNSGCGGSVPPYHFRGGGGSSGGAANDKSSSSSSSSSIASTGRSVVSVDDVENDSYANRRTIGVCDDTTTMHPDVGDDNGNAGGEGGVIASYSPSCASMRALQDRIRAHVDGRTMVAERGGKGGGRRGGMNDTNNRDYPAFPSSWSDGHKVVCRPNDYGGRRRRRIVHRAAVPPARIVTTTLHRLATNKGMSSSSSYQSSI